MKTKSGSFINSFIAMALVIAMICPYAYAADVGRATYVEGRVDVARQGFDFATPLREGDSVAIGDAIRTKSNSKAEVTFNDKSMVRLAQNTRIQVRDYVLDADNKRKTAEIMVDRGKTRTIIEKMPGLAEFNISTPNAKGTVHGSDVYTSFQAGSSSMLVAEGSLSVRNPAIPKEILTVPAGNSVMVQLDETPKGMRPYMEFEKKLQEQDTAIPVSTIRSRDATILKGAFTKISGDVRVTSKGSENSHKAMLSDVLGEGDTIETGAGGIAEISFENGNGMSLQENTRITIIKLIQDPKTKQYENRFEASMGKVRSRIEKLKETKSTFEIRTPTGVCGARGTLMYLQITPTGVKVFFEGGTGYLNSLISSVQSTVDAGQSAYADNSGNVSEPETLSGEERESWGSGWDTGNGTEGYSSEGGTVGIYLEGGDTGTIGGLEIVGSTDISIDDLFVDIPFPVEEETVPEEPVYDANFNLKGNIFHYCELVGTISGSQGGLIGSFWNEEQYAIFSSAGSFNLTDPAKEPFVWTINDDALQSGSSVTATGGAFYGLAGGIGGGDVDGGILEGLSMFIYIDPDGNVGIGGGKLIGLYSNADAAYFLLSTLEGLTGTILPGIYADPENIKPETSALSFVKNTNYSYDENINMNVEYLDGVTLGLDIPDQEFGWSIWGMKSCGTFSGTAPRTMSIFNLQIIGESSSRDGGDGDYWFGLGSGLRDTGSGKLSGAIRGMTLSGGKVGIFSGDLLGATIGCSSWEMVGLGQQETMGITGRNPKNADDFLSCIERGSFSAGGYGSFDNGSAINAVYMDAETFNFYDQDWGVWEASLGGTRDMETSDIFKIAIGGKHVS